MGRGGTPDREGGAILLARAARLWEVSRGTAYIWHRTGKVHCFRGGRQGLEATLADVRAEKVLPESAVLSDKITRKLLDNAIACGLVVPEGSRFSLADRDELRRLAGIGPGPETQRVSERHQSGSALIAFRWTIEAERQWVGEGADPADLPEEFWATPRPPRYIAPANVFLYRLGKRLPEGGPKGRFIWRSAGYEARGAELVWCEAVARYERLPEGESMPQAWTDSSHHHRLGREQWLREWQRRQTKVRSG